MVRGHVRSCAPTEQVGSLVTLPGTTLQEAARKEQEEARLRQEEERTKNLCNVLARRSITFVLQLPKQELNKKTSDISSHQVAPV